MESGWRDEWRVGGEWVERVGGGGVGGGGWMERVGGEGGWRRGGWRRVGGGVGGSFSFAHLVYGGDTSHYQRHLQYCPYMEVQYIIVSRA